MGTESGDALRERLPRELGPVLRSQLPELTDEILRELQRSVPEYDRPLQGQFGRDIRVGVDVALTRFVDAVEAGGALSEQALDVYRALGRAELREGRSLDALQSAYRIGARVAWRRNGAAAAEAGFADDVQRALAEAIFAYIDELSAASVEGYAAAQTSVAREHDRRRRRLLEALLDPAADRQAIEALGAAADWRMPSMLAVCALEPERVERVRRRLSTEALVDVVDGVGCVVWPDAAGPGRASQLERALGDARTAVGPAVPPESAASWWRWTRRLLAGETEGDGLRVTAEHLLELVLGADPELLEEMARRRLAPLAGEAPASRRRLEDTLLSWLR
ncbi:MAG: hypothetical protein QOG46_1920, partial [Pseudonocardiales bacterium]|nr:hypothetical protein [Pseudonocardiales bacterium]